ncbi:MAG: hypothetical protein EZS28_005348 [Streblomastix strix]|uniref:Uncharacterized protein n=1 Tax=Streblomastix strix TaxID=222440 RepID=A0A5J4WVU0_9EUKA|nr:MAG: hypothetical protein EZS28_005348 [Streblomastix strix]
MFLSLFNSNLFNSVLQVSNQQAYAAISFILLTFPALALFTITQESILNVIIAVWGGFAVLIIVLAATQNKIKFGGNLFSRMSFAYDEAKYNLNAVISYLSVISILAFNYPGFTVELLNLGFVGVPLKNYCISLFVALFGLNTYNAKDAKKTGLISFIINFGFLILLGILRIFAEQYIKLQTPDSTGNPSKNIFFSIAILRAIASLLLLISDIGGEHVPLFLAIVVIILRILFRTEKLPLNKLAKNFASYLPKQLRFLPAAIDSASGHTVLFALCSYLHVLRDKVKSLLSNFGVRLGSQLSSVTDALFFLAAGGFALLFRGILAFIAQQLKIDLGYEFGYAEWIGVNFTFIIDTLALVCLGIFFLQLLASLSSYIASAPLHKDSLTTPLAIGKLGTFLVSYLVAAVLIISKQYFTVPAGWGTLGLTALYLIIASIGSSGVIEGISKAKSKLE